MRLEDLTGRRVTLLGLGADVGAALPALRDAAPAEITAVEAGPVPDAVDLDGIDLVSRETAIDRAEVFVRSPGFPRYDPDLVAARRRGAAMTTPLDLWMGSVGPSRRVAAVTGTKGKSTVVALVEVLARRSGMSVGVAGNLGPPVFSDRWDHTAPLVVLEVSSYQAADLHHVPDVAVLTFLAQDHLSWHGSLERYVADKLRVLRNEAGTATRILVGGEGGRARQALAELLPDLEAEVVEPPEGPPTVPTHRLLNAAVAAAVLEALGGPRSTSEQVVEAARSSMPGRLDHCPGPDGLFCLDDALASNPSATAAALAWLRSIGRPTVVLLGGDDRGVDVAPLRDEAGRWARGSLRAVTLPGSARLAQRCGIDEVAAVDEVGEGTVTAVRAARAMARNQASGGRGDPAVILSPGAPTPAGSGNWETRSAAFRSALGTCSS